MICQFAGRINTPDEDFWKISFEDLYKRFSDAIRSRRAWFYIPSSKRYCNADGYILNGGYGRKRIVDIQLVQDSDGNFQYEEVEIKNFRIQRILEKGSDGKTHAILPEIFVPYKEYTLRYILFHVREYFRNLVTQEKYCLDAEIDVKIFRIWLKWIRDHITVLAELGLTKDYRDNWQIMRQWVQKLTADISGWTAKSLKKLNLCLFQERPMPENTLYRNYEWSG